MPCDIFWYIFVENSILRVESEILLKNVETNINNSEFNCCNSILFKISKR